MGGRGPHSGGVDARRTYQGVDRGFIFFDSSAIPWKGITNVDTSEDGYSVERYFVDGRLIGTRQYKGNYHAEITSYDDPFVGFHTDDVRGFSYREPYVVGTEQYYRLHVIHGANVRYVSSLRDSVNVEDPEATTFYWEVDSIDVSLRENGTLQGSHLILDSAYIFPWSLHDIESVLYDQGRMPLIDEMFAIFSEMNLVIIDHGDGTWSAVGHESMIRMLDQTECEIASPTIYFHEDDPRTFDIEDLIRDPRWLE